MISFAKAVLAAAAVSLLSVSAMAVELETGAAGDRAPYSGYAVSQKGRMFRIVHKSDAVQARNAAKNECEHKVQGLCEAFSVGKGVRVVVLTCNEDGRSASFLGADRDLSAEDNALIKATTAGFAEKSCAIKLDQVAGAN